MKQQKFTHSQFESPEIQNQGVSKAVHPRKSPEENASLPLPASGLPGAPWLVVASLPLSARGSPSGCVSPLLPPPWALVFGFRAFLSNPGLSHLKILDFSTSAKPLFPNKVTFAGLGELRLES